MNASFSCGSAAALADPPPGAAEVPLLGCAELPLPAWLLPELLQPVTASAIAAAIAAPVPLRRLAR